MDKSLGTRLVLTPYFKTPVDITHKQLELEDLGARRGIAMECRTTTNFALCILCVLMLADR